MKKITVAIITAFLLIGCAGTNPQPKVKLEDFPLKPIVANFKDEILTILKDKMKEPSSVKTKDFGEPERAYTKSKLKQLDKMLGWRVLLWVNAKNSYGGFTGFNPYYAFITKHGKDKDKIIVFSVDRAGSGYLYKVLPYTRVLTCKTN